LREGEELLSAPKAVPVTPHSPGSLFGFLNFEIMVCELERGDADYLGCMLGSAVVILFFVPHVCSVEKDGADVLRDFLTSVSRYEGG